MWSETQLIERYFQGRGARRADVVLGIGDDAALLHPPADSELVLTTDALVEGVHFLAGADPRSLGHRALAINLSDIAAMGATPTWALLSLTLPQPDESWLGEFSAGLDQLARDQQVALVGGNLTRGPLAITVQLAGVVPSGCALRRSGARPGDALYVSGTLGDAAAALALQGQQLKASAENTAWLRQRADYPTARVGLGQSLRAVASACIDVSDGLYADLQRLLEASGCGAVIDARQLPLSEALRGTCGAEGWRTALAGGEDYELCFTVPAMKVAAMTQILSSNPAPVSYIGHIRQTRGIALHWDEALIAFSPAGWDHFRR